VWEESIVLLPHAVRFVFLSATIPNAREFAEWVAKIHHQVSAWCALCDAWAQLAVQRREECKACA